METTHNTITIDELNQERQAFGRLVAIVTRSPAEREAAYYAALEFADAIDVLDGASDNSRLTRRFRNRAGTLLLSLDEVVRAALAGDLVVVR